MKTMRIVLLAASAVLMLSPAPASATSIEWRPGPNIHDMCKSDWIKALDAPCETRMDDPILHCEPGVRPHYEWRHRFRFYTDGAWSPWWVYSKTYSPVPAKACSGQ